jgi:hypothetical protein
MAILIIFIVFYAFLILKTTAEGYLTPALEKLAKHLKLSE